MQLRFESLSPFCRKVLAAIRHRRDRIELIEVRSPFEADPLSLGASPLLITPEGAWTRPEEIVARLQSRHPSAPRLLPADGGVAVAELDRILDLYLIEPSIVMARKPDSEASIAAVYTALRALDLVDDRLRDGRCYLCGEALTLADLTAIVGATDVQRQGLSLPTRVEAWVCRMRMLPAVRNTVDEADAAFELRAALCEEPVAEAA